MSSSSCRIMEKNGENIKRAAFHSLGCKVNSYETEVMTSSLKDAGYEIVPFDEMADVYIVNTCSVTNIADRKSRQMLHRARKMNPDALIVAAGCYVQGLSERGEEDELLADGVDIIIGNEGKVRIADILEEHLSGKKDSRISPSSCLREYEKMNLCETAEHTRAFIKVEDGCDQFCSYCIIPHVRGRVRSRSVEDVLSEAKHLAAAGYKEIVLTGINLSAYGKDLGDCDLGELSERLCDLEDVKRIRISSLEPRIVTEDFASRLARLEKVCPHFHLSLQSGCDRTLRRMNRHYTAGEYEEAAMRLRREFFKERGAYPALTTDVIVGFPGESEADFEECAAFLKRLKLFETHVFKFSARKGTPAAGMEGQLSESEKSERSRILLSLNEINRRLFTEEIMANKGYTPQLLLEERIELGGESFMAGHTGEYIRAAVRAGEELTGTIVRGHLSHSPFTDAGREICVMDDFEV